MATEMVTISNKAPANVNIEYSTLEKVLLEGDLSQLKPDERMMYYSKTCQSLGLNPLTRPFDYIRLNGKLTLYARKDATDQLRKVYKVSITKLSSQVVNDIYIVTAEGEFNDKKDSATGAVNIKGLSGDALANAMMKAETKAKRRLTLSIVGLGMLDETEIETIKDAKHVVVIDDYIERIKLAQNMDELKIEFEEAKSHLKGNKQALADIAKAKDERKNIIKKHEESMNDLEANEHETWGDRQ